jgi:hypothetical protein
MLLYKERRKMPEISRFLGIIIKMFPRDHNPPHFHAFHGNHEAMFSIATGKIIEGDFPNNKKALVTAWAILRKKELMKNWNRLSKGAGFDKVDPLR